MTYQDATKTDALLRASSTSLDPCVVTKVEGIVTGFLPTKPQVHSQNMFSVLGARSGKDVAFPPSSSVVRCQLSLPCSSIFIYALSGGWTMGRLAT